ncbi:hypothetical protein ES319_D01G053000v1 [Gossypium barbadense]|uniref:Leucine-rich repeat-containing N-terminal plant-type domain-containing protein n=1 Tax=Gossypium barbadense TaxID=3634 RepID=A0A5J5SJZ6_GOSBA|nr:hypothetical protein ES319_D01G053000v1 [Gossypium barbadense]
MGNFIWLCQIRSLLLVLFFLSVVGCCLGLSISSLKPTPLCLPEDASAFLQFKNTMSIDYSSDDSSCYPKTSYWNESTNCCSWKGVNCDKASGQVFGLDLSCSLLVGSLSPNTSPFRLQGLKRLNLASNDFNASPIQSGFRSIPASIGNLTKITFLDLSLNEFEASLPTHVTGLQNLNEFFLNDNSLTGGITSWPFTLPSLKYLDLSNNSLTGPIDKIQKPNSVQEVYLAYNHMHGEIQSSFFNLANLIELDLSSNNFSGLIKSDMLLKLKNLETLVLSSNNFNGAIKLDVLSKLKNLSMLELSHNKLLSLSSDDGVNSTFQKLETLYFSSCNVQQFPNILRSAKSLRYLDLSNNAIKGSIFKWESEEFWISNNNFTGEIPPPICNLTFPQILDLSKNYLGGIILKCLGSSSYGSRIINLQKNIFKGKIPDFCADYNGLINLALNDNQLEGPLPRSLINSLQVLILRFNRFHGLLNISGDIRPSFSSLQIVDLSGNEFNGVLPTTFFQNLNSLKHARNLSELVQESDKEGLTPLYALHFYDQVSVNVTWKKSEMELEYIRTLPIFTAIDFSNNRFSGKIPEAIGELRTLEVLNLSHNSFTGNIPPSLGNLVELESLDLSSNNLSGEIPFQMTKLTFLEVLNFSHNNLVGPIPHGNQFNTFENDSYYGNLGLCGFPLTKQCGNGEGSKPPAPKRKEAKGSPVAFIWKLVMMGYGCGVVLGLSTGYLVFTTGRPWWFVRMVERYWKPNVTRWICRIRGKRNKH